MVLYTEKQRYSKFVKDILVYTFWHMLSEQNLWHHKRLQGGHEYSMISDVYISAHYSQSAHNLTNE